MRHEHCKPIGSYWQLDRCDCYLDLIVFFLAQFFVSVCALVCAGETWDGFVTYTVQLLDLLLECNLCIGFEFLNISGNW